MTDAADLVLDYWMRTYAPEFCRDEHVAEREANRVAAEKLTVLKSVCLPEGEQPDITAVKELREYANLYSVGANVRHLNAIADKLEAELVEVKRERDELCEEVAKIKHGDGWRAFEDAKATLGRIIGDDYADRSMWPRLRRAELWWNEMKARAESAESSLAQANEALKAVNKLIEWERENGTHFVLIDREVEYVSGLWFDAKNAVITALKTAGKE